MKKELSKASNIYANNDIYRKENVQSPHVIAAGGLKGNPANYNRTNNNQYQNNQYNKIKGQAANCQDGYGFQGFYPKHGVPPHNIPPHPHAQQGNEMFTKHEIEFHQKGVVLNNQQSFSQQFHPVGAQKFESHDYEHQNNMIKTVAGDLNHKVQGNNNVNAARPTIDGFQQNQMYYNENATQNPHHNQYYPNEFDVGSDGANPSYFDPKTQQQHYYEMNYHHQHGGVAGNDYAGNEMYGPNAIMNENCENFSTFQQYYEHHQQQQQQQTHQQQQNMHPHYHVPSGYAASHQQNFNNSNPQIHPNNAGNLDNSNSSSDFNFLSNLNDFAPEYYQLS